MKKNGRREIKGNFVIKWVSTSTEIFTHRDLVLGYKIVEGGTMKKVKMPMTSAASNEKRNWIRKDTVVVVRMKPKRQKWVQEQEGFVICGYEATSLTKRRLWLEDPINAYNF